MMKQLLTLVACFTGMAMIAQPVITSNPKDDLVCLGNCTDIAVTAVGNGLMYQWQVDDGSGFVNISGQMADSLSVCDTGAVLPSAADYRCVVIDENGDSVVSLVATVSIDSCLPPEASFTYVVNDLEVCFTSTSSNAETLIWNFGNGKTNTSNVTNPCSDYEEVWEYDVSLFAFNDYGSDSILMTISLVGLEEIAKQLSVYPNPASDYLIIDTNKPIDEISLVSLDGRVIRSESTKGQINLRDVSSGVYLLKASIDGRMVSKRIVVSK